MCDETERTYWKFHLFYDSSAEKVTKFSDEIPSLTTLFSHLASSPRSYNHDGTIPMHAAPVDFSEKYRALPDEEIASLFADIDSLTEQARSALLAEIQQRGLAASQLQKLHSVELRHEAQFDRLERLRRKRMVLTRLGHHSLKGWIFVIVGAALLALIELLIFPNH